MKPPKSLVSVAEFSFSTRLRRLTVEPSLRKFEVFKKIFLLFFTVAALGGLFWWFWARQPVCSKDCPSQFFVIKKGEALGSIAQRLEDQGLVRSSLFFQLETTRLGFVRRLQAGNFRLNSGMKPSWIADNLTHGTLDIWITIVEGWRREEIAEKLAESFEEEATFDSTDFLARTKGMEGKLFPDTYLISRQASAEKVVETLISNFENKTSGLNIKEEDLILASLIEREVASQKDRPIVAGILLKRLENSWSLQVDATVQFAKANKECSLIRDCRWWSKDLTSQDLKIDSSYNTYLRPGLPPGPICNPGLASIKAVLNPEKTNYWFYLSDSQGKIHYSQNLEEHKANIQKYLQ